MNEGCAVDGIPAEIAAQDSATWQQPPQGGEACHVSREEFAVRL